MLRVYDCVTDQHDLRLVVLAAMICLLSSFTALSVFARARAGGVRRRWFWLTLTPVVFGAGVWSTHFVAMLALQPGFTVGYDLTLTALSIVVAMAVSAAGFLILLAGRRVAPIGGAVVGMAIAAMHYTGIRSLRVPAALSWQPDLVLSSLALAAVLGAAAFWVFARGKGFRGRLGGALLLTLAICGLHFTGMAAVSFRFDPAIAVANGVLAPEFLAVAVAAVTVLIVALGLAGSILDQHLAQRALAETGRLHGHIAELERIKSDLETTTGELKVALAAADEASRAKSAFLATMSHELRTPLNAVIGFSEIMVLETFGPLANDRYRGYASMINESGMHLLALINDVLDFSKIDAGRLQLDEGTIDVRALVEACLRMVRGQADSAGVSLLDAIAPSLPSLHGDARRISQILLNLLSNAVKFTPRDGEVLLSADCRRGVLAIAVADTGIGIAAEDIPRAFERFGQVDNQLNRRFEGAGLGLPLSRRLMELHDGTLELTSTLGVGTTVTMVFPSERCRAPAVCAAEA